MRITSGPVTGVEIVDPTTLRIHTNGPAPLLPEALSRIVILSRRIDGNATTEDFNSGKAMIGTGPYRLVSVSGMNRVEFERKDDYSGPTARSGSTSPPGSSRTTKRGSPHCWRATWT